MKCPKCGYLGFETSDRCRNCGYDFSLTTSTEPPSELPLQRHEGPSVPFGDFELAPAAGDRLAALDLDRVIGTDATQMAPPEPAGESSRPAAAADNRARLEPPREAREAAVPSPRRPAAAARADGLPLFTPREKDDDRPPVIAPPRPAGPPLSVRRATPDVPRVRPRAIPRRETPVLELEPEAAHAAGPGAEPPETDVVAVLRGDTSRLRRMVAAAVDFAILGGIDVAVIRLTLAIAGLTAAEVRELPVIPMAAFLLLLNAGYLVGFTAAGGQTIGKMLTRVRVTADDGGRVDAGKAVIRAAAIFLTVATLGLGYLPVFGADARALHDRLAGTRVLRAR